MKLTIKTILIIIAIALLLNVGSYGVIESSDARYAEISREMYISGDYIHPTFLNIYHYHKPPITYQITALAYHIFGVTPFAARFFLQISVLLQIWLIYALTNLLFNNNKTARWAAIIYFSFPIVFSSRTLTTDNYLANTILLAIYFWVKYRKKNNPTYLYPFALSLAIGMLIKGPVVFILPLCFTISYNKIKQKTNPKLTIHHLFATILFLIIGLSWYLYLAYENKEFFAYFLGHQTIERFSTNTFHRSKPFWYFILHAPLVALPWLIPYIYLSKQHIHKLKTKKIHHCLTISILIPILFFSISKSKLILYILPLYPLLAIQIARLLSKATPKQTKTINKIILSTSIISIFILILAPFIKNRFHIPAQITLYSIAIIPIIITIYKHKNIKQTNKAIYTTLITTIYLLIAGTYIISVNQLEIKSPKPITDFIIANNLNNREILVFNTRKPAIAFGLNKAIISLNNGKSQLNRETQFEKTDDWKKYLINMKNPQELQLLKQKLKTPTVLILHKHLPPQNSQWLLKYYQHHTKIGRWFIYY